MPVARKDALLNSFFGNLKGIVDKAVILLIVMATVTI